jgi:hypothetical protein
MQERDAMSTVSVQVDRRLWSGFVTFARRKQVEPQSLLADLLQEYLEAEEDLALESEMRRDLEGRELSNRQAVRFVHRQCRQANPSVAQHEDENKRG